MNLVDARHWNSSGEYSVRYHATAPFRQHGRKQGPRSQASVVPAHSRQCPENVQRSIKILIRPFVLVMDTAY
jgi:hypothetical protein